jgi:hypothetical protein
MHYIDNRELFLVIMLLYFRGSLEAESLTQTLALWGAVTCIIGTVAGIANWVLRFKQHKKDQPKLLCTSEFSFEHLAGVA